MSGNVLITGGAGFIGSNLAAHLVEQGRHVVVFDNFCRAGAEKNLEWLEAAYGEGLSVVHSDVRRPSPELVRAVEDADVLYHLAAQVAVTTSVVDPRDDFEVNALGTFNVLEAVRQSTSRPIVLYSSTNKVYGKMDDLDITEDGNRYRYASVDGGISESRPLDLYSPYGCSKGAGDQYVLDYARIYGLKTVVFRQSCIYGPRQFGMEDQGWVAWFTIRAMQGLPVAIYGDGKQVRDVLYVDDLIAAYDAAVQNIDRTAGQAYNIGGGPENTLCLLELLDMLQDHFGHAVQHTFDDWRPGDQLVFVSDVSKAEAHFGWKPRVHAAEGVTLLARWVQANAELFAPAADTQGVVAAEPALVTA